MNETGEEEKKKTSRQAVGGGDDGNEDDDDNDDGCERISYRARSLWMMIFHIGGTGAIVFVIAADKYIPTSVFRVVHLKPNTAYTNDKL